ncbi:MAG: hypothetical protein HF308_18580 [Ignavibacteria bacterium]|jgi:hypothetical protein|nr:hypothetical protein [Ignavibacteria bacterium]
MSKLINLPNNNSTVYNGEYYAVDKNKFQTVIKVDTDYKGVIYLSRDYANSDVLVYVSDAYDFVTEGSFILMPKKSWSEVKQTRGKNAGKNLNVYANGTIWTYKLNKKALVFVRRT